MPKGLLRLVVTLLVAVSLFSVREACCEEKSSHAKETQQKVTSTVLIEAGQRSVLGVAVSHPTQDLLLIADPEKNALITLEKSATEIGSWPIKYGAWDIALLDNRMACAVGRAGVVVYDIPTRRLVQRIEVGDKLAKSVAFLSSNLIAVAVGDGDYQDIELFNIRSGKRILGLTQGSFPEFYRPLLRSDAAGKQLYVLQRDTSSSVLTRYLLTERETLVKSSEVRPGNFCKDLAVPQNPSVVSVACAAQIYAYRDFDPLTLAPRPLLKSEGYPNAIAVRRDSKFAYLSSLGTFHEIDLEKRHVARAIDIPYELWEQPQSGGSAVTLDGSKLVSVLQGGFAPSDAVMLVVFSLGKVDQRFLK